jgi:hypothetical protein
MWMGQTESRALMILIVVLATERCQAGDYREKLVDVTGFEPATPCLQIQKANLEGEEKNE